jgi:hypothetical protein
LSVKRQRENLLRPRAPRRDEPGDPAGDDLCFAGAGARDDEQRTLAVRHGGALLVVEALEDALDRLAGGRRRLGQRRGRVVDEAELRAGMRWTRCARRHAREATTMLSACARLRP